VSFDTDKAWSDRFIPSIKSIVGPLMLEPSSLEVNTKQAADLVVLTGRNLTIACRIRRHKYAARYPRQFTIRSERKSGAFTELKKFVDGWGDWMFYGFESAPDSTEVLPWYVIDLNAFRAAMVRNDKVRSAAMAAKDNVDLSSSFVSFSLDLFTTPPQILIASSDTTMVKAT